MRIVVCKLKDNPLGVKQEVYFPFEYNSQLKIILFESDDIDDAWDGTYKSKSEQIEVFGYYFTGECLQGEKITLKGNLTLLK